MDVLLYIWLQIIQLLYKRKIATINFLKSSRDLVKIFIYHIDLFSINTINTLFQNSLSRLYLHFSFDTIHSHRGFSGLSSLLFGVFSSMSMSNLGNLFLASFSNLLLFLFSLHLIISVVQADSKSSQSSSASIYSIILISDGLRNLISSPFRYIIMRP